MPAPGREPRPILPRTHASRISRLIAARQVLEPGYEFLKGYSIPSGTDVNVFRRHIDEHLPAVDVPEVVGLRALKCDTGDREWNDNLE